MLSENFEMNVPFWLRLPLLLTLMSYTEGNVLIASFSRIARTNEPFTITCSTNASEPISWLKDGEFLSSCSTAMPNCYPPNLDLYDVSSDVISKTFNLTIKNIAMNSCGQYMCSDTSKRDSVTLTVVNFKTDNSSLNITEPSFGLAGDITVVTDCLFPDNVSVQWSIIQDGEVIADIKTPTYNIETCSTNCSGIPAVKIKTVTYHNETDEESITVAYKLVIKHHDVEESMNWTSQQRYNIRDLNVKMTTISASVSDKKLSGGAIAGIVIGILGPIGIAIGIAIYRFRRSFDICF